MIGLLAALGAYGWYAFRQFDRLNELNQRQLARAGVELERTLATAVENLGNFRRDLRGQDTPDTRRKLALDEYRAVRLR